MMGLQEQDDAFCKCVDTLDKWADHYLSPSKGSTRQDPEQWRKYIDKLNLEIPYLRDYEDEWPAKAYVQIWCHKRQSQLSRSAARAQAQPGKSVRRATKDKQQTRASAKLSEGSGSSARAASAGRVLRSCQIARALSDSSRDRTPVLASPRSQAPIASSADGGGAPSVEQFLRSLVQPLGFLLPALVELGVREPSHLLALRRMTHAEAWLQTRLVRTQKVTELQLQQIMEGLYKLPGELS
ncbi:hypothetical protein OH77DRAFT_1416270 [Trametes cingulata]|nr:hypothetical protein OH77DRAFT_1416270 [Trametes cingulata]